MKSIACAGTISAKGELLLDEPLPQNQPSRVQIVILFPEASELADLTPAQWNKFRFFEGSICDSDTSEESTWSRAVVI